MANYSEQGHNTTVPRNAVIFTCVFSCLLSLINIGSTVAFSAIISLQLMVTRNKSSPK